MPSYELTCPCDGGPEMIVLYVAPARFRCSPQVGTSCLASWSSLSAYLGRPTTALEKDAAGAWSPALYRDDVRRKASLLQAFAIVVDVDQGGDVAAVAASLVGYRAVVHSTFSSTNEAPRCRIVLALAAPIDASTYERLHAVVRAHLRAAGIVADEGAKDASRLSYSPVVRPGAEFHYRTTDGAPLDARGVLDAQAPALQRARPPRSAPEHAGTYQRAALRRAAGAVAAAPAGARHAALNREAHALARLDLAEHEIAGALLPAFVESAGEGRRREGERTIRDAVRARRGVA
jgi:hypothetical protein